MSFYRTIIAALVAAALVAPVFADEVASADAQSAIQVADNTVPSDQTAPIPVPVKIDLNSASAKDLLKVKGLNASKVRSIISYRKKHGEFKSLDDLKLVKGFKKVKVEQLQAIQDQLSVG